MDIDLIEIINVFLIIFLIVVVMIQNVRVTTLESSQRGTNETVAGWQSNPNDALKKQINAMSSATNASLDNVQSQIQTINNNNAMIPQIMNDLNIVAADDQDALLQIAALSDRIAFAQSQINGLGNCVNVSGTVSNSPVPYNAATPTSAGTLPQMRAVQAPTMAAVQAPTMAAVRVPVAALAPTARAPTGILAK